MFCGALKATVRRVNNAMDCCHRWFWSECLFGIWDRCTWQRPISHKYYHNRSMNMIYKRIREKFIYHIVRQSNALERDTRPHHRSDLICNVCFFVFCFCSENFVHSPHRSLSHTLHVVLRLLWFLSEANWRAEQVKMSSQIIMLWIRAIKKTNSKLSLNVDRTISFKACLTNVPMVCGCWLTLPICADVWAHARSCDIFIAV